MYNCHIVAAIFVILIPWSRGVMSDIDCGEGRVRDLDGTCVKKVIIPQKKAECPKLSIDNGDIFLIGNGRMVKFFCDTDYIKVPDTGIAICQVTGHWSKVVPACLMPGCKTPPSPAHGEVETLMEYNDTVAVFSCHVGHVLTGYPVLGCVDGQKWNGSVPECREIVSDEPQDDVSSGISINISLISYLMMASTTLAATRTLAG